MSLPNERKAYEFEQATVSYRKDCSAVAGTDMPRIVDMPMLEVMVLDAYGFQREFSLRLRSHSELEDRYWEAHTYQHPGRRNIQKVRAINAERFILRFLDLCERYPTLLFNATDNTKGTPRSVGFVRLSEQLLCGEPCSVRLLK